MRVIPINNQTIELLTLKNYWRPNNSFNLTHLGNNFIYLAFLLLKNIKQEKINLANIFTNITKYSNNGGYMSTVKNNASASATGFLYQFYVALDRCFDLLENQSIYIETYGDITNNGIEQTEVKHCNRTLTDFDINFWKTLSNWLTLETQNFKSLVLLTTQKIGSNSSIKDWNQSTPEQRVKILKTLRENYKNKKRKNSEIEKFMDNVLKVPETILVEEIGKVSLVTQQPKYKDLYKELCEKHGKCVLKDNRNKFINDLIGYIISQKDASNSGWEITYGKF